MQTFVLFGLLLWHCSGQAYLLTIQIWNCYVSWGRNEELITQHDSWDLRLRPYIYPGRCRHSILIYKWYRSSSLIYSSSVLTSSSFTSWTCSKKFYSNAITLVTLCHIIFEFLGVFCHLSRHIYIWKYFLNLRKKLNAVISNRRNIQICVYLPTSHILPGRFLFGYYIK